MSKEDDRSLNWPLECPECGTGKIVPLARSGRTARYSSVKDLPVPADFKIPTCEQCGSEWVDGATAKAMDEVLKHAYREHLKNSVAADLRSLSEHVTQRRLEESLGLSHGYLSKVRSGASRPSEVLARLLRLLAADPEHRLREMEEPLLQAG